MGIIFDYHKDQVRVIRIIEERGIHKIKGGEGNHDGV